MLYGVHGTSCVFLYLSAVCGIVAKRCVAEENFYTIN